ncbi:hypothetical protein NC653_007312 [Populus alba x Populus x berolinensis]|uniref:Uncharacterized protein n=1 Tax=Populus alba x Populus x berolinensis TaxID=444605 RepID=A0AAD6RHN4_9ROSI|nr:hypothetical protein NC653_007312 [Populus alba x Populus x berolinensis]
MVKDTISNKEMNSDENEASDTKDEYVGNDDDNCEGGLSNGTARNDESAPHKNNSKLSLLGHGPHGKQVVDHILEEYGEDGIRQFCQRWRQVFVEGSSSSFLACRLGCNAQNQISILSFLVAIDMPNYGST